MKINECDFMFKPAKRVRSIHLSQIRKMFELITEDSINMGLGEPDFNTPPHIIEAVKEALDDGFTHYTVNKGIIELREAISRKLHQDNNLNVDPESIIVTLGASEALLISTQALIERGNEVLVPDPGFLSYDACVKLSEGASVPVELKEKNEFRMTPDDVLDKITDNTKAIILNSPANPTGSVMKKGDIRGIADIANDHDLFLISDEIYEKIVYSGKHYSPAKFCENTITINGFSKTYAMTGFRIGYIAASPDVTEEMLKVHQYNTACASSISQKAALSALEGPQNCVDDMVNEFRRRRDLIVNRLNQMGITCSKPEGAFYVFPKIEKPLEFVKKALKNGVVLVPGSAFGKCGENHVRFSYATSYDEIAEAMDKLESVSH